jgi:hypothetical protein
MIEPPLQGVVATAGAPRGSRSSGLIRRLVDGPAGRASPSSRSRLAKGEAPAMAQTNQAWDWGVELREDERSELELLRGTVAELRRQLDQAHNSLRSSTQREQDARQALRQLDEARPWQRRQVRTALRGRQLL